MHFHSQFETNDFICIYLSYLQVVFSNILILEFFDKNVISYCDGKKYSLAFVKVELLYILIYHERRSTNELVFFRIM